MENFQVPFKLQLTEWQSVWNEGGSLLCWICCTNDFTLLRVTMFTHTSKHQFCQSINYIIINFSLSISSCRSLRLSLTYFEEEICKAFKHWDVVVTCQVRKKYFSSVLVFDIFEFWSAINPWALQNNMNVTSIAKKWDNAWLAAEAKSSLLGINCNLLKKSFNLTCNIEFLFEWD